MPSLLLLSLNFVGMQLQLEHALIDQLSIALTDLGLCKPHEHAQGPWLVHTAFVATDGGPAAYIWKW